LKKEVGQNSVLLCWQTDRHAEDCRRLWMFAKRAWKPVHCQNAGCWEISTNFGTIRGCRTSFFQI